MDTTTNKGMQLPTSQQTSGGENRQDAQRQYRVEFVAWCVALIVFIITCVIIHDHPRPYPVDLFITESGQNWHTLPLVHYVLIFPSIVNNPVPSAIALGCWLGGMLIMAAIEKLRGKSPLTWLQSLVFLGVTVMSSAGLNSLLDVIVGRPRPNPKLYPIHVYTPIVPFPTYPSGHTEHDVVYYGFLLYLSFIKPVREWRYHWLLLPLQIYAVYDILFIGYSRLLEGDHWFTDVLGGYLEGFIYLFFFIFLYRWVTGLLAKWRMKRQSEKQMSVAH